MRSTQTTLNDLIIAFHYALANKCDASIQAMLNENPQLREWYEGKLVNDANDDDNQYIASLTKSVSEFKSALRNEGKAAIETIWNENALLQDWYMGKSISFRDKNIAAISSQALISNFKSVLSAQYKSKTILKAIWNENERLQQAIKALPIEESVSLLKSVISSKTIQFISEYLKFIDDGIIYALKKEYENKVRNKAESAYLQLLETYLGSGNEATKTKRKVLFVNPYPKKGKELESKLSLEDLVSRLPRELNGLNHFIVKEVVGDNLKRLKKTIRNELTISSISASRQVKHLDEYKVTISDPLKYQDYLNKFAVPLSSPPIQATENGVYDNFSVSMDTPLDLPAPFSNELLNLLPINNDYEAYMPFTLFGNSVNSNQSPTLPGLQIENNDDEIGFKDPNSVNNIGPFSF